MRVMVLGAGLLGVTSAYYLQQLGHEVTVVDRHAQPAANALGREGTFSDSAQAATHALMQAAREARERAPMRANLARCLGALPAWWARRTGAGAGHDPGVPMEDFWRFSRHTVQALKQESAVPSPRPGRRLLQLYMDRRAFEATAARQPRLQAMSSERQLLSAEDAMRIEPMLQALGGRLAGATLSQDDFSGDASAFAAELVFLCRAAGVRFLARHTVVALRRTRGRVSHVDAVDAQGEHVALEADAFVLALGPASMRHAREAGIDLPLRFVREYRLGIPTLPGAPLPQHALQRAGRGGCSLHAAGTADAPAVALRSTSTIDLAGPLAPQAARFLALRDHAKLLMPGQLDTCRARLDSRVLVQSANGLPLIGRTPLPNLFLNTAPGRLGWVHACGAGKSIAHIVTGLRPEAAFAFTGL